MSKEGWYPALSFLCLKHQSHCQVSRTRFLKHIKTAKHLLKHITYGYIRSDKWLVKHSRNLVKPNSYLERDQILTQCGGENHSKTRSSKPDSVTDALTTGSFECNKKCLYVL